MTGMRLPLAVALTVALSACSLAPEYVRPSAPIPESFAKQTVVDSEGSVWRSHLPWRDFVKDAELQLLVEHALVNNRDLRQALLNVDAVRAQYRIQRAGRFPELAVTGNGSAQRLPDALSPTGQTDVERSVQAGIGLSAFELDLFGRLRNLSEAAMQEYLATGAAARASQIALIAEVAKAYAVREGAIRRHAVATDVLESRRVAADLVRLQGEVGTASSLDYQEALSLSSEAEAELESALRQSLQAENLLSLLVAEDVNRLVSPANGQMLSLFNEIEAEVSSVVLQGRPDVQASEHELIARNADIGAARAAFFPRISLTGFLSSASPELSGLFDGGTRSWNFSPVVTLPIFSGGRNRASLELATLRKDMAIAKYEYTLQTAFREVSDALVAVNTLERECMARARLRDSAQQSMHLSDLRFQAGLDSRLRNLEAQRTSLAAQLGLVQIDVDQQLARIELFKALGGGWSSRSDQGFTTRQD